MVSNSTNGAVYGLPDLRPEEMRFYPLADSLEKVSQLMNLGYRLIQLRTKSAPSPTFKTELKELQEEAKLQQVLLFLNDDEGLTRECQLSGCHLGQQDLQNYPELISQNETRPYLLGISTHSKDEFSHALNYAPDYLAFGPVFSTPIKPELREKGLDQLCQICKCSSLPLVAIGGITFERCSSVFQAGAEIVAFVRETENILFDRIHYGELVEQIFPSPIQSRIAAEAGQK